MDKFVKGAVSEDEVVLETAKLNLSISMVTTIVQSAVQTFKEIQQIQFRCKLIIWLKKTILIMSWTKHSMRQMILVSQMTILENSNQTTNDGVPEAVSNQSASFSGV